MARTERGRRTNPPAPASAPGTLFVVATPIGNLEDITLRALKTLREVQLVAAEDTRRTGNLLRHYSISTPLVSVNEHNELARVPQLISQLSSGQSIALVSDAGTPGVSDPGARLVSEARRAGIPVRTVPGPSALTAAASISALLESRFAFAGFPPVRSNDRKQWFDWVASLRDVPVIAFESPHRLHQTLTDCSLYLVNRPITVARELTKIHEEVVSGSSEELIEHFPEPRGEFVMTILPASQPVDDRQAQVSDAEVCAVFGQITEAKPSTRREAIRRAADRLRLSPNAVYTALERRKKSGK